tara:strand:+ start:469 stop:1536 length:1068 start_codon:yes stop_codon:yes gene_type:complete
VSELFISLYNEQKYDQVISSLKDLSNISQTDPTSAYILAATYFKVGQYQDSFDLLIQLETVLGSNGEYWTLYGSCARRLGRLSKAKSCFQIALESNPTSLSIQNNYANLLVDLHEYDQAIQILQKILNETPAYEDASVNLNRALFLKKSQSVASTTDVITNVDNNENPFDPLLQAFSVQESMRTMGLKLKKQPTSASKFVASINPSHSDIEKSADFIRLAKKSFVECNFTYALELCSAAYNVIGFNSELFVLIADIYISLQRYQEAEIFLLHSQSIDPASPQTYFNLVTLSRLRGDKVAAKFYLTKLSGVDPTNQHLQTLSDSIDSDSSLKQTNLLDPLNYVIPNQPNIRSLHSN